MAFPRKQFSSTIGTIFLYEQILFRFKIFVRWTKFARDLVNPRNTGSTIISCRFYTYLFLYEVEFH